MGILEADRANPNMEVSRLTFAPRSVSPNHDITSRGSAVLEIRYDLVRAGDFLNPDYPLTPLDVDVGR